MGGKEDVILYLEEWYHLDNMHGRDKDGYYWGSVGLGGLQKNIVFLFSLDAHIIYVFILEKPVL